MKIAWSSLTLCLAFTSTACTATRRVEYGHVSAVHAVEGGSVASTDGVYQDRRWLGFWPFQPVHVRP